MAILQSLILSIDCCFGSVDKETVQTDFNAFFALFFPFLRAIDDDDKEMEICKTMMELNIPYNNEEMLICPVMTGLTTMFPNVHNKWMNDARNNANRTDAIQEENLPSTSTKIKVKKSSTKSQKKKRFATTGSGKKDRTYSAALHSPIQGAISNKF